MIEVVILLSILMVCLGFIAGLSYQTIGERVAPLTKKGVKIKKELQKEYGKKKGESILYAMENKGSIKGVTKKKVAKKKTTKKK